MYIIASKNYVSICHIYNLLLCPGDNKLSSDDTHVLFYGLVFVDEVEMHLCDRYIRPVVYVPRE